MRGARQPLSEGFRVCEDDRRGRRAGPGNAGHSRGRFEKYGSCDGQKQELEGPPIAEKLLPACGYAPAVCARVCYLIGHHHTYVGIDGADYQILVEADFLVNIFENGMAQEAARKIRDNIFKTKTGRKLLTDLYL